MKALDFGIRLITLAAIMLVCISAIARQNASIDSLEKLLPTQSGRVRFESLNLLAIEYTDVDNSKAYRYARQLYPLSFAIGDSLAIVKAGLRIGAILKRLEKTDSALTILTYSISIARRHNFRYELKYLTNNASLIYAFQAKYQMALSLVLESLEIRKQDNSPDEIAVSLTNMAIIYYKMKSYQKSLEYNEQAIQILKLNQIVQGYDNLLINRGLCKIYLNREEEGIEDIDNGLKVSGKKILPYVKLSGLTGLAIAYVKLNKLAQAKAYLKEVLQVGTQENQQRFVAEAFVYLARIESLKSNATGAVYYLKEAEYLSKSNNYNELLITVYEESIVALQGKLDPGVAVYQQLLINLKQEVYSNELRENLSLVESDLRKKENSVLLENQAQILKLNEALIDKREMTVWVISALCFMITVLLAALYRINKFKRDANVSIEKSILLQTAALTDSLRKLEVMQENKRVERDNFISGLSRRLRTIDGLSGIMNSTERPIEIDNATNALRKFVVFETKQL